jgi:RHS repeat-associated protein
MTDNRNATSNYASEQQEIPECVICYDSQGQRIVTGKPETFEAAMSKGDELRPAFAWTGRELDAETGLQYNRVRCFDPFVGRWISDEASRGKIGEGVAHSSAVCVELG